MSMLRLRTSAKIQFWMPPRPSSYRARLRHTDKNASWTASSARSLLLQITVARPKALDE
jgi:hypothetical protein